MNSSAASSLGALFAKQSQPSAEVGSLQFGNLNIAGWKMHTDWIEDVYSSYIQKWGDIPASYVSLPEGSRCNRITPPKTHKIVGLSFVDGHFCFSAGGIFRLHVCFRGCTYSFWITCSFVVFATEVWNVINVVCFSVKSSRNELYDKVGHCQMIGHDFGNEIHHINVNVIINELG